MRCLRKPSITSSYGVHLWWNSLSRTLPHLISLITCLYIPKSITIHLNYTQPNLPLQSFLATAHASDSRYSWSSAGHKLNWWLTDYRNVQIWKRADFINGSKEINKPDMPSHSTLNSFIAEIYNAMTTTIRLRFDDRSTTVRLLIKGH